jgi:hypothetical protein
MCSREEELHVLGNLFAVITQNVSSISPSIWLPMVTSTSGPALNSSDFTRSFSLSLSLSLSKEDDKEEWI